MVSFVLLLFICVALNAAEPLAPVPQLDLARYAGTWFEIARTPNRFEADCVADVRVTYEVRPDGKLSIRNECRKQNGKVEGVNGYAKRASAAPDGRLRATFFWPFFFDYWVIAMGGNYEWAAIGEPSRRDLWILSRTPKPDAETYQRILNALKATGYDVTRLKVN